MAISELLRNGRKSAPSTVENRSSVGWKKSVGGSVAAWFSSLNAVSTIHSTGETNTRPTNQVNTVRAVPPAPPGKRRL